jgi:hypothetical protein
MLRAPDGSIFSNRTAFVKHVERLCRIADAADARLVRYPGEVASQSFEVLRLKGCEVVVLDAVAAVAIEDCDDCRVFVGPCAGAVVVRNCRNCLFTFITQHLRVKASSNCIFTSFVQSSPAIESSTGLTFGPLNGSYPQLSQHARAAGLAALSDSNNHVTQVVDFSEGDAELGEAPHWLPLDTAEWDWDSAPADAHHGSLTPVAQLTVASLLDRCGVDGGRKCTVPWPS